MKLRIISGLLKGRYISLPDSEDFRPTLERTRESIAEIIKHQIPEKRVADICAGSGAMGFELLSRGALKVDFIERDRNRAELIKRNAQTFGVADNCQVINRDVRSFLKRNVETYDIIYYDPPYDDEELKNDISLLLKKLNDNGIMLYELRKTGKNNNKNMLQHKNMLYDCRTFGDTVVEFYCKSTISK